LGVLTKADLRRFILLPPHFSQRPARAVGAEPTRLTWRDKNTLISGENDARTIVTTHIENGLRCFICGDADDTQYGVEHVPGGDGFIVFGKPENKR